jgi:hypothetical protein
MRQENPPRGDGTDNKNDKCDQQSAMECEPAWSIFRQCAPPDIMQEPTDRLTSITFN